jgi:mono/diheme cytochrome c family protein
MVRNGEQLFKTAGNCWACHGEDATGARGVGADLTDDEWWHSDGSYEAIVRAIRDGVPADQVRNAYGAVMPPLGGSRLTHETPARSN